MSNNIVEPDKQLVRDNETRWNGAYLMGQQALELKDHILVFLACNKDFKPADKRLSLENHLTSEDWRIIAETITFLKPFYDQTKRLQS